MSTMLNSNPLYLRFSERLPPYVDFKIRLCGLTSEEMPLNLETYCTGDISPAIFQTYCSTATESFARMLLVFVIVHTSDLHQLQRNQSQLFPISWKLSFILNSVLVVTTLFQ
ncbi:unnamed protein product [Auanema sp. JU1783]|nr:unnamed protein product [Auanema sp. JU1783]